MAKRKRKEETKSKAKPAPKAKVKIDETESPVGDQINELKDAVLEECRLVSAGKKRTLRDAFEMVRRHDDLVAAEKRKAS